MSLDEINYVKNLEQQINILKSKKKYLLNQNNILKQNYDILNNYFYDLNNSYTELYNKYNESLEIVELDNWIIHRTNTGNEFVSGFKTPYQLDYNDDSLWETSNIISKTPTKYGLFIITKTEHIYYLPYTESYY